MKFTYGKMENFHLVEMWRHGCNLGEEAMEGCHN